MRLATYNFSAFRMNGAVDAIAGEILHLEPDILAFQEGDETHLSRIASACHLDLHMGGTRRDKGFLSTPAHTIGPLTCFPLGSGGELLLSSSILRGKRFHIANIQLSEIPAIRFQQIRTLVGPEILGSDRYPGTLLVVGDFGGPRFHPTSALLSLYLRHASAFRWTGNYPAHFPYQTRHRLYYRGDVTLRSITTPLRGSARHASAHLPTLFDLHLTDTLIYERQRNSPLEPTPAA